MCDMCESLSAQFEAGPRNDPALGARADQGLSQGIDDLNEYLSVLHRTMKSDGEDKKQLAMHLALLPKGWDRPRLEIAFMLLASSFVQELTELLGGPDRLNEWLDKNTKERAQRLKEMGDLT